MRSRALDAARRGYVVVAPDAEFHGGWLLAQDRDGGGAGAATTTLLPNARHAYTDALIAAYRAGGATHPFLLDNVWNCERVIDWLVSRPDVDRHRIGVTGVSLGGMHAWLLAVADGRVAAAAPLIGVQSFAQEADDDAWRDRAASVAPLFETAAADAGAPAPDAAVFRRVLNVLAPGLLTAYDAPAGVPTVAPRPFLAVNGELDGRNPLPGVRAAMDAAAAAYAAVGAADRVALHVEPGVGHAVTPAMDAAVTAWLDRWLAPGAAT